MTRPITFPQDLIDSFRSNEVIGIIGSGLSLQAGFPNWKETLELMISECQRQLVSFTQSKELKSLLRKGLYPEVAEECADLLRGDLYRNFIQNTFGGNRNVPTKVHELLLDLPLSAILTTNYDTLIERTYANNFEVAVTHSRSHRRTWLSCHNYALKSASLFSKCTGMLRTLKRLYSERKTTKR